MANQAQGVTGVDAALYPGVSPAQGLPVVFLPEGLSHEACLPRPRLRWALESMSSLGIRQG